MARLLITGASGLLGFNLVLAARRGNQVIGVSNRYQIDLPGIETYQADLTDTDTLIKVIEMSDPEYVINCAAAANVDECERKPGLAEQLNVELPSILAVATARKSIPLIHISTDAVCNGERGNYTEEDEIDPINQYARSKALGEAEVLEKNANAAVVRTNIFGWNIQTKQSLAEWFLKQLEAGSTCPGFRDVQFSPILVNDLGTILLQMVQAGCRGVHHVGGSTCLSKYDFGKTLAQIAGLNGALIFPTDVEMLGLQAKRPKLLCLDSGKIERELGIKLPSVKAGLERFVSLREKWLARDWDAVSELAGQITF